MKKITLALSLAVLTVCCCDKDNMSGSGTGNGRPVQNEYVNRKLAAFDNAIAMLQAAVFSNETDGQEEKSKRVFNLEVKGFKRDEE